MPNEQTTATAGLILGFLILAVTAALGFWLWRERKTRPTELSPDDRKHFSRQDRRRAIVVVILGLLAAALALGTRVPYKVGGRPNPLFVQIWVGAVGLLMALVLLSMMDWVATRFYAKRRRLELLEEGIAMIERDKRDRHRMNGKH